MEKNIRIRKLGVGSVARFVGIAHAIIGFVSGVFVMFAGLVSVVEHDAWSAGQKVGVSLAVVLGSLILLPIIAFLYGWLYGAVLSLVANLFLQTANGIELTVEDEVTTSRK